MSAPRVLCIAGSPRRGGNSDALLDALETGVREAGGVPVRLVASQAGIAPCRGCNACSRTGVCVIRDGMDTARELIDAAHALAIATPVYFATVPAVLKVIYDRCQPYWARRYVLGEPAPEVYRPGALLLVGGGGDPFGTACAVTPTRSVLNVLGVSLDEVVEVVGADSPGDVARFDEELEHARALGRRMCQPAAPSV